MRSSPVRMKNEHAKDNVRTVERGQGNPTKKDSKSGRKVERGSKGEATGKNLAEKQVQRGRRSPADEWRTPEAISVIEAWGRGGLTLDEIAANMQIARSTLMSWKKKYPDISDALKRSRAYATARVENALFMAAVGHVVPLNKQKVTKDGSVIDYVEEEYVKPDAKAMIFYLTNRAPDAWKMNRETAVQTETEEGGRVEIIVKNDAMEQLKVLEQQALERAREAEESDGV